MTNDPSRLRAENLTIAYDGRRIVQDLSLSVPDGKFTAIIGPNGCGKSTLLRGLSRILRPASGRVTLDGVALRGQSNRFIARRIGMLPQSPAAPVAMTVAELVTRGRTPYLGLLRPWGRDDQQAVDQALAMTRLTDLADAPVHALSGGQRQRAWIAMVLAQETPILLLDEPTTFLDLAHQIEVLSLLQGLTARGKTVVAVLHDLNLTARFADYIVAMRDGRILHRGAPGDVVTEAALREIFSLEAQVIRDPLHGAPLIIPR